MRLFQSCGKFIGHIAEKIMSVEGKHVFRGIADMRDNTLCVSL